MKYLITIMLIGLLTGCVRGSGSNYNSQATSEALFRMSDQALKYSQPQQIQPRNISCMPVGNHITCNQW